MRQKNLKEEDRRSNKGNDLFKAAPQQKPHSPKWSSRGVKFQGSRLSFTNNEQHIDPTNLSCDPAVNFRPTDYVDLIDWQACNVIPPTVLRHISSHELLKMIQDDVPMDVWDSIKFPSPTQAVERIVKLVTEASRKRDERRTGMDLSELQ
ncbi:hypothetical protein AVEN_158426-1 [Araneus ventricosus]|uniref:Uncharacterized protein n=1 Tax=Araneus ventricosus TaxID=182803 RepID=A0A4Y2J5D8_ARAVE|nr:hypothetical protein AVEN_158426-1 [Araneus ventricosus]